MKNIYASLSVLLIWFSLPAMSLFGQTYIPATLNVAGGSNEITGGIFEFSIGEMTLVHTATAPNIIVTQGVLQPGQISTGIFDHQLGDGQIKVYPNPVDDVLNVDINLSLNGSLQLHVYDLAGKLISQKQISVLSGKEATTFSFAHFAAGNYVLNAVFETGAESYYRNFKIVKLK